MTTPLIIGHRGATAFLPENTLPSFKLAFEKFKVDMIEFDLRAAKDGVPVVIHDARLERTTNGKGFVIHKRWGELKELDAGSGSSIPTLEEVLQTFPQQKLALEIKDPSAAFTRSVMETVNRIQAQKRVIVGSKHHVVYQTMKSDYPEVERFCSQREVMITCAEFKSGKRPWVQDPLSVVSIPTERLGCRLDSKELIDYFHEKGFRVFYWTINDADPMRTLAQRGADGIITDNPELANQVFGRK